MFSSDSEYFGLIYHSYHGQKIKEYYSATTPIHRHLKVQYQQICTVLWTVFLIFHVVLQHLLNIGYTTCVILSFYFYYCFPLIGNMNKQPRCLLLHWTQSKSIKCKVILDQGICNMFIHTLFLIGLKSNASTVLKYFLFLPFSCPVTVCIIDRKITFKVLYFDLRPLS